MPPAPYCTKFKKITLICLTLQRQISSLYQLADRLENKIKINHHHHHHRQEQHRPYCGDSILRNNIIQPHVGFSYLDFVTSVLALSLEIEQIESNVMRWRVHRVGAPLIKQTSQ